jgi:hypothetical protein
LKKVFAKTSTKLFPLADAWFAAVLLQFVLIYPSGNVALSAFVGRDHRRQMPESAQA